MMRYLGHILWLLGRPLVKPFSQMRRKSEKMRAAELDRYKREQAAALHELKLELLLAHRQAVRGQAHQDTEGEHT